MRVGLIGLAVAACSCALSAEPRTIHGYITAVAAPAEFSVGAYVVTRGTTLEELRPGMAVEVRGEYDEASHHLRSTAVKVLPEDSLGVEIPASSTSKAEEHLARAFEPKLKTGEIDIPNVGRYRLLVDAEAQAYAQRIGESLCESLAKPSRKLQFYLVQDNQFFALALPNGTVIASTAVLRVAANEAQFAAVLAHEIAHVIGQHASRSGGDVAASIKGGYSQALENQADRLSLQYLTAAGYDPRAAAAIWAAIEALHPDQQNKSFWGTPGNALLRETYLTATVEQSFPALNFISYSLGGSDFARLAGRLGDRQDEPRRVESGPTEPRVVEDSGARHSHVNSVTVVSDPTGSEVVIGGQIAGKTPMTFTTGSTGMPFSVTVRKAGYFDWYIQSTSVPGNSTLRADLHPMR